MEKKPYHHNNLKIELIEKGIEIVNKEGILCFSLRKVASVCGVSHAAPYNHFSNKEELLEAMQQYVTEQFSEKLEKALTECKIQDQIIRNLGIVYVHFFVENPQYFYFLYSQSNLRIDLSLKRSGEKNYKPFEIYKDAMLTIMKKTNYPEEKQKDTIIALWAYAHGIASLATMENVYYDEDWATKIEDFIDTFQIFP